MKRLLAVLLTAALALSLCACGGDVSDVKVTGYTSEIYSDWDIESAIGTAIKYFQKNFDGCTLTEITYLGDEKNGDYQDFARRHDADEVIVLISSFDVDSSGGDGSLNPDSTYTKWKWILVRDKNGSWRHADHGYG